MSVIAIVTPAIGAGSGGSSSTQGLMPTAAELPIHRFLRFDWESQQRNFRTRITDLYHCLAKLRIQAGVVLAQVLCLFVSVVAITKLIRGSLSQLAPGWLSTLAVESRCLTSRAISRLARRTLAHRLTIFNKKPRSVRFFNAFQDKPFVN